MFDDLRKDPALRMLVGVLAATILIGLSFGLLSAVLRPSGYGYGGGMMGMGGMQGGVSVAFGFGNTLAVLINLMTKVLTIAFVVSLIAAAFAWFKKWIAEGGLQPVAAAFVAAPATAQASSPTSALSCPHCQTAVSPEFKFCPNCKQELKPSCKKCGKDLQSGWKVCPHCGKETDK